MGQMGTLQSRMLKSSLHLTEKGFDVLLKITQAGVYEAAGCKRPKWITEHIADDENIDVGDDDDQVHLPTWKATAASVAVASDTQVLFFKLSAKFPCLFLFSHSVQGHVFGSW
jgi:hypothetical protein